MTTQIDISGKIGPLYVHPEPPEWPVYSFDRPSYELWNAIATGLHAKGWSEKDIKTWMQSKMTQWALDGSLGESIIKIGTEYAKSAEKIRF